MQWDKAGGRVLLFDKLTDLSPESQSEHPVKLYYSKEELFASIQKELGDLLNTRCKLSWKEYKNYTAEVPYGLPSLFGMWEETQSKGQMTNMKDIAQRVKEAVELFEPRLLNVVVTAQKNEISHVLEVTGDIIIEGKKERAFFPITVDVNHKDIAYKEQAVYNKPSESPLKWHKSLDKRSMDK